MKALQFSNSNWIQSKCKKYKDLLGFSIIGLVLTSVSLLHFLLFSPKRILFRD